MSKRKVFSREFKIEAVKLVTEQGYGAGQAAENLGISANSLRKRRRKFKVTTDSNHDLPVAENLLDRQFAVAAPNRVWVCDITSGHLGADADLNDFSFLNRTMRRVADCLVGIRSATASNGIIGKIADQCRFRFRGKGQKYIQLLLRHDSLRTLNPFLEFLA